MTFSAGTKLGSYEIVSPLGAGGMGEVYRARDSKLKREVAIKVLPDAFARDAERVARFQREAEVLASLNHPHIAAIHDVADFGDCRFLVLELVEGQTLADCVAHGPIPLNEALAIATQIAEALEAAHEKGIIHRDLKPANVKLDAAGTVKVLDFGLAKVRHAEGPTMALSNSPTVMSASMPGTILGTAAYMSPEQAKGKEADRASDMWAFGCVIYEILTGHAVFDGGTMGEILAGVFKEEPDWTRLPSDTPEGIRRLLRRCLQKDEKLRLRDMRDARIEIDDALDGPQPARSAERAPRRFERVAWIAIVVAAVLTTAIFAVRASRLPAAPAEMRLEITTPPTTGEDALSLAISPDGRQIVFAGTSKGRPALWLRSLDSTTARVLNGTDGASFPFWSPDSRSIGFFADNKLKRIDIDGGSPQSLATASGGFSPGTWSRDGVILYSPIPGRPILRVSASGGPTAPVTRIEERGQTRGHTSPSFLPDGRHFFYTVAGGAGLGAYVGQLDGSETKRLIDEPVFPTYVSSGHLLFVRQGTLFAQQFDLGRLELRGKPFQVAEHVPEAVAVSDTGTILYRTASGTSQVRFTWFDRSGKEIGTVGDADPTWLGMPSISPDGRRLAFARAVNANDDVWLLDLARGVANRFTSDPGNDVFPVWAPDGMHIAFSSTRIKGAHDLYRKAVTGATPEDMLLATPEDKFASDWSPDGRYVLYSAYDSKTQHDIWALPVDRDHKPFPVVQTEFEERNGQFSPDGRWIAYQSNESGRFEIYVQPFPGPGARSRISNSGGAQARWRRDGKELFYIALDGRLMAVPIRLPADDQTVEAGAPVPLFLTRTNRAVEHIDGQQYVVSPDGQRFLINTFVTEAVTAPITVILNWKPKE